MKALLRPRTILIAAVGVIGFLLLPHSAVMATCAPQSDLPTAMADAESVSVGEVLEITEQSRIASMSVLSVWKGPNLPERVEVHGTVDPAITVSQEDARFIVGSTYLVIPENTRQPFLATACSATLPIDVVGTVIPAGYQDAVGATSGRLPLPMPPTADESSGAAFPTIPVAAAGAVAIAVALVVVHRRTEPTQVQLERREWRRRLRHRLSPIGLGARLVTRSGMRRVSHNRRGP